jgi:hypothetical protein
VDRLAQLQAISLHTASQLAWTLTGMLRIEKSVSVAFIAVS